MPKNSETRCLGLDDPLSVTKEFVATSIHVLWSNFTKIGRREVDETMRCFSDKKFGKCGSFAVILGPFGVPPEPTPPDKILSQWVPVCRSYFEKSDLYI